MTKGSTPTKPKHLRTVAGINIVDDVPTRAQCTRDASGVHPESPDGQYSVCPACYPALYAKRHRRRAGSFRYSTTEAHGVTR